MHPLHTRTLVLTLLAFLLGAVHATIGAAEEPADALAAARKLLQQGKYAEADEAFAALPEDQGEAVALGRARSQESTGRRERAAEILSEAIQKFPQSARLMAEAARLTLERGDRQAAQEQVDAALKLDGNNVLARWVQAELLSSAGKLTEADAAYKWLVDDYNAREVTDADELHRIGLAAAQFARWNRLSDQFSFLVNELYPELIAQQPDYWQAHYEAGRLFAEKYNQAEASKELKAALAINPNSAELQTALGELALEGFDLPAAQAFCDRALEINSQLLAARHLKADIHLANFEPRQAAAVLQEALKLHPTSEETLGRLAAAYLSVDGLTKTAADSRFGKLETAVTARNPHAGLFYQALGEALDRLRRWPAAAAYYQQAMTRMPQLIAPPGELGMMLMRLGEEEQARLVLDEALKADPFNVRVNNTLKVLEVLDGYETHETEHFRIKYDPAKDKILARYMGQWLEEVYPELVKQMGYAPPEKSLFEVFSQARNTDGHGWFSARMVGLPHIHPIGACAGKVVALKSPSEGKQRFNWARVLKHEFVHVINLQQTEFNIPHWFTEALAVLTEGNPRPQSWNELLVEASAKGKLFNLETINRGFIRPHSSSEWTLAYCQAELYAEYMQERFGETAIARMLSAYADNLTTPEAIGRAFGVAVPDFEAGYSKYVKKLVAELPAGSADSSPNQAELERELRKSPKDAKLLAQMAQAQLDRRNYAEARRWADAALKIEPRQGLASYVRARLHMLVGENKQALERLEAGLDRAQPQENLLALLAGLRLKAEDYPAAAELYQLGATAQPGSNRWLKSLAAVYLKSGENEKLVAVLTKLAEADPDDLPMRKKLAQMALGSKDYAAADRWAREGLHIQVMDPELHRGRAEALAGLEKFSQAAEEYAVAVELAPDDADLRIELAKAYIKANQPAAAQAALQEALKLDAEHAEAKKLLESLE